MEGLDCSAHAALLPDATQKLVLSALAQAGFAMAVTDTAGVVTYVNPAFTEQTGYLSDEIVGQPARNLDVDDPDGSLYRTVCARLARGQTWSGKLVVRMKDGTRLRARAMAAPVSDEGGQALGFSLLLWNTAEELKLEAQLRQLQKMEAIGEMAAGIAHEINTPIQYVGDNIQFLRDAVGDVFRLLERLEAACEAGRAASVPAGNLEAIAGLREEIDLAFLKEEMPLAIDQAMEGRDRVAAIVRAMKEFAHPSDEEWAPVDVNHAIENTLAVSRGEWKYVAEIEQHLDASLPPVPCFPGLFNQVLLNLVVNAAHAIAEARDMAQDGKGKITLSTRAEGTCAVVAIGDNGCGIAREHIHRIFEPFYTTKDVGKGTGQGLALAHAVIVDKMGGRIDVDSTPGSGTEFRLYLGLEQPEDTEVARPE